MCANEVVVSELDSELQEAIEEGIEKALTLLKVEKSNDLTPQDIVFLILEYIDAQLNTNALSKEQLHEYSLYLGALWGEMVVKVYGWQWKYLAFPDNVQGVYVVSPENSYCCPPLYFVNNIMMKNNIGLDGENDNTVGLLFHMIENLQVPSEKPYQVLV